MKRHSRFVCLLAATLLALGQPAVSAKDFDLATATIQDINAAIDAGALSSEKLVQLYLNRIAAYDQAGPKLNTIITLNPKALELARELDAERKAKGRRSPLHGIPVVVKDLINTSDMPTTGGFIAMKGAIPQYDANVIRQLRDAGAIILAKMNMSDWLGKSRPDGGSSLAGLVLNPYDLSRGFAGSSSGTGSGISSYLATVGLGSETGTSIRGPTTDGSLFGLAGTEGLVGRSGAMANSFTHERIGPIARNMYDLAVTLDYLVGIDANDLITAKSLPYLPYKSYTTFLAPDGLRGARVGVLRDMFRSGPEHQEGLALADKAIFALRKAGADVYDPVTLGLNLERIRMIKVNYWEEETILDKYLRDFGPNAPFHSIKEMVAKFPDLVKPDFISFTNYVPGTDPEYRSRLKARQTLREAVVALMDKYALDAVVFPFKTIPAAKLSERDNGGSNPLNKIARPGDAVIDSDNYLSSMTGLPGLLVPMGYVANGIPLSLEFLGRPFSEPTLIKLASGFEAQTHLRKTPPTVPALPGEKFSY